MVGMIIDYTQIKQFRNKVLDARARGMNKTFPSESLPLNNLSWGEGAKHSVYLSIPTLVCPVHKSIKLASCKLHLRDKSAVLLLPVCLLSVIN